MFLPFYAGAAVMAFLFPLFVVIANDSDPKGALVRGTGSEHNLKCVCARLYRCIALKRTTCVPSDDDVCQYCRYSRDERFRAAAAHFHLEHAADSPAAAARNIIF